jgi:hypothetical protein
MIFKITPRLNQIIKASAIILLLMLIVNSIIAIGNVNTALGIALIFYIVKCMLAVLLLLYIISTLVYFGEKKYIVIAFIIYTAVDVIGRVDAIVETQMHSYSNEVSSIIGLTTFLVTIYLFIASLPVRSKVIFPACLLFTISLFAMAILKMAVTLILPYLGPLEFRSVQGFYRMRTVIDYIETLSVLIPIAFFILANRVNRYLESQQIATS